jgi:hypothetical protein
MASGLNYLRRREKDERVLVLNVHVVKLQEYYGCPSYYFEVTVFTCFCHM